MYPIPPQLAPHTKPQNEPPLIKKDKEPLYQPPNPTVHAFSRPPDMNMLAVDPDTPNPIASFLKTLTLDNSRELFAFPIIEDFELDLSNLGLEEVFMTNTEPKVEEEDDVLCPKRPLPPPPPIFPPPPLVPEY
nr:hypothetical protein CFP56_76734 [Quercus suber]